MDNLEIKKIEQFIEKASVNPRLSKYNRVVILTDSKGNYLRAENEIINIDNLEIIWWATSGRNTLNGVKYLVDNIKQIRDNVPTLVLFWHFTCDATKKVGKYIYPNFDASIDLIDYIKPCLETLREIHFLEESIDIGILEIPPIFTKFWNKSRNATDWESTNDTNLNIQINELNSYIRECNT